MVPFDSLGTVSYSHSIAIMALSCIISEIKRDIGRKSRFFHTSAFDASVMGTHRTHYCHNVWCGDTRMVWLPDGERSSSITSAVLTEYRHVTDEKTDTQHTTQHSVRYAQHSAGINKRTPQKSCSLLIA